MKMSDLSDDTTIFLLRDINCHNRIQSILKPHKKASSSKTNFRPYEIGHIKIELTNPDKLYGYTTIIIMYKCTLKNLECILLIPSLITTTGT